MPRRNLKAKRSGGKQQVHKPNCGCGPCRLRRRLEKERKQ